MSTVIDKRIIALTGLPRSGSTVLMSILNQNTSFTSFPDSDLSILLTSIKAWSADKIKNSQLPHKVFHESIINFCRSGAESWLSINCPTSFSVDKNRAWLYQHQFMFQVFPNIKMILNIRDLRFVVNSILKTESNTFSINFQNYYEHLNEDFMLQRIKKCLDLSWVKQSLVSLKELVEIGPSYREQLLIFRHEELILNPQNSMNRIYDFFDLPRYEHNFDHIEQIEPHYDNLYVPYGDHQIKSKLETKLPETLSHLPQKYADWIVEEYRWFYEFFYPEVLAITKIRGIMEEKSSSRKTSETTLDSFI
jgi:sulfotransferase